MFARKAYAKRLPSWCSINRGEGHGCHQKAIELLGIGSDHLHTIEHDDAWRMRPEALAARIKQDRREGLTPIAVIATAGTVNTGAIDPLEAVAEVCREHDVWLHVDGAYGAPAILSKQYERALAAIAVADSVALDPHKSLCVPVEAGLVLIRHSDAQRAASSSDFEVCEPQSLGIVYFRFLSATGRRGASPDLNSINQTVLEGLQLGGDAFVSSTSSNGVFWLRACVLNPSTSTQDLHTLLDALRGAAAQVQ